MRQDNGIAAGAAFTQGLPRLSPWRISWPLVAGVYAFLFTLYEGHVRNLLLLDGDTFSHIAIGQWIWQNGVVPDHDPLSQSMRGAAWTAQEWLSQVILARAHDLGGWNWVVGVTALAFAATIALLTRALLRTLEPSRALLFAVMAVFMTAMHLLARPHILAMPFMMLWMIELVRARDEDRTPRWWMLPLMTLWANMHGGFTLGYAIALALAFEALLAARKAGRLPDVGRSWGLFLVLAAACALITPHGIKGFIFTWQVLVEDSYALDRIGEWASPNFHTLHPMEIWLLGGLAVVMHQGLRLPPLRLVLLLGLTHLALKHVRSVELLGLIVPLLVAAPLAAQWAQRRASSKVDSFSPVARSLAQPAGHGAVVLALSALALVFAMVARVKPVEPPVAVAPVHALEAVRKASIKGPVLNDYGLGGFLMYSGVPPFIDGRSDLYRDDFIRSFLTALELSTPDGLEKLLDKHAIAWTFLRPGSAAVAMLDRFPGWTRLYTDDAAVVHIRTASAPARASAEAGK